jgi:hypothetical protein
MIGLERYKREGVLGWGKITTLEKLDLHSWIALLLQCLKHKHIVEVAEIIFIQDSCRWHLLVNWYACDVVCVHEDDPLEERKRVRKRKWYANLPDIIEKQKKITRKYELKKNKVNIQGEQLCKSLFYMSLYRLLWTYIWLTPLFNKCDYKIETS